MRCPRSSTPTEPTDFKTNWLYFGDVGPNVEPQTGISPEGYDEINQAPRAGNFGWPFCTGPNEPFTQYDFATKKVGPHTLRHAFITAALDAGGPSLSCPPPQPTRRGNPAMQPITVEIDTGSASARGRPPDRIWLVRLRRANRHVITTIGLSRISAEHLAEHITDVLNPPEETLVVTELIALLEFYAGWLNADIDYARARLPLDGAYRVDLFSQ